MVCKLSEFDEFIFFDRSLVACCSILASSRLHPVPLKTKITHSDWFKGKPRENRPWFKNNQSCDTSQRNSVADLKASIDWKPVSKNINDV